jgi:hypothetical protein
MSFDTERDAPPGEESLVRCVQWVTWPLGTIHLDRGFGAILIAAVDEERQIYRRTGWAKVYADVYFDEEFTDITLI